MTILRDRYESQNNEDMLDIKELGYLLQLVDSGNHSGLMLELALSVKHKLQGRIQSIMKNKEEI
jgi:hypothetical protein|tara:strand:- start:1870 stop:2061 length:192 start_codon:yes stop_codon:yes gene_type:complete